MIGTWNTGQETDITGLADFSSSHPNVISVQNGGTEHGLATCNAVGRATLKGEAVLPQGGEVDPILDTICVKLLFEAFSPGEVNPTVSVSCDKQHLALGPTAPATTKIGNCSTSVVPAGGTFSWSVNTNAVTLSPFGSTAEYTVANPSASQGDTIITVTYTVNKRSATAQSAPITVHKPTSLFVESDTTNPTGKTCDVKCLDGSPGCSYQSYLRTRVYVVQDQFNQLFTNVGIDTVDARESFSGFTSTCGASEPAPGSDTGSRFRDDFDFCSSACLPGGGGCTNSATQTITVNGLSVRTVSVNWTCTGVTLSP
ncbi:MAG: hypothetical protein ACE5HL_09775 [Terriglobia bacterium]